MTYEISLINGLDVSGHWSGHNSLGVPKLDIADDEAVIGQMVVDYNRCGGDQSGCLQCDHQDEDIPSVVCHVQVGEVLHLLQQFQLTE